MNEASPVEIGAVDSLSTRPDWRYVLQEFHDHYRAQSSGGSEPIRAHQRKVRAKITQLLRSDPAVLRLPTDRLPVVAHLRRALDGGKADHGASIVRAIDAVAESLRWQYGYDRVPRGLATKFAFAEFAGPSGPVECRELILGIVLFAPGCVYPAHAHAGISESYVCLSGAMSENHQGVYGPGSLIFNPPGHMHRITVSDREPTLLAWAWEGDPASLAGNKMTFSRKVSR
jgi:dimethylpropiothetin dethiomethylase